MQYGLRESRLNSRTNLSTVETIMKLRMCIDPALRRGKPLFLNGEDLSKASNSPERAIKDIALRRLGAPESVVDFLASLDEGNEVHITTKHGATYETPGLDGGFQAQYGVKQGTPQGPFVWLAVSDIVWTAVERISTEVYQYEARKGPQIGVPLPAFVDDGIHLNRGHDGRQFVLNVTSMLYSLLGLERNGEKCFAAELDPERDRGKRPPPRREPPYISTCLGRDDTWETTVGLTGEDGVHMPAGTKVELLEGLRTRQGTAWRSQGLGRSWPCAPRASNPPTTESGRPRNVEICWAQ